MPRKNGRAWPIPTASSAPAANSAAKAMRSGQSRWCSQNCHSRVRGNPTSENKLDRPHEAVDDDWRLGGGLRDHLAQERLARIQFTQRTELIRPVGLFDGAGAADHRRNAVSLEM